MRVQTAFFCENELESAVGVYVAEAGAGRCADTALAVVCRGEPIAKTARDVGISYRLLMAFKQWFECDFSGDVRPFSAEVVERYWEDLVRTFRGGAYGGFTRDAGGAVGGTGGALSGAVSSCPSFAVLLVHGGQYVFCGWGELAVYEYTCERHGFRRWKVGQEREELDRELGIPEAELSKLTYRRGQVPDGSLYLILPWLVRPEHLRRIKNRRQLERYVRGFRGVVPCAVAIRAGKAL